MSALVWVWLLAGLIPAALIVGFIWGHSTRPHPMSEAGLRAHIAARTRGKAGNYASALAVAADRADQAAVDLQTEIVVGDAQSLLDAANRVETTVGQLATELWKRQESTQP